MKIGYLLFFGAILGLSACQWGEHNNVKADLTTDTLTYTYKAIKERAADCGTKPDSGCTVVKINYPVFKDQDTLNSLVSDKLINLFGADEPGIELKEYVEHFLSAYTTFKSMDIAYNTASKLPIKIVLITFYHEPWQTRGDKTGTRKTITCDHYRASEKNIAMSNFFSVSGNKVVLKKYKTYQLKTIL